MAHARAPVGAPATGRNEHHGTLRQLPDCLPPATMPSTPNDTSTLLAAVTHVAEVWRLSPTEVADAVGMAVCDLEAAQIAGSPAALPPTSRRRIGHLLAIYAVTQAYYGVGTRTAASWLDRDGTAANDREPARASLSASLETLAALHAAVVRRAGV